MPGTNRLQENLHASHAWLPCLEGFCAVSPRAPHSDGGRSGRQSSCRLPGSAAPRCPQQLFSSCPSCPFPWLPVSPALELPHALSFTSAHCPLGAGARPTLSKSLSLSVTCPPPGEDKDRRRTSLEPQPACRAAWPVDCGEGDGPWVGRGRWVLQPEAGKAGEDGTGAAALPGHRSEGPVFPAGSISSGTSLRRVTLNPLL